MTGSRHCSHAIDSRYMHLKKCLQSMCRYYKFATFINSFSSNSQNLPRHRCVYVQSDTSVAASHLTTALSPPVAQGAVQVCTKPEVLQVQLPLGGLGRDDVRHTATMHMSQDNSSSSRSSSKKLATSWESTWLQLNGTENNRVSKHVEPHKSEVLGH